MIILKLTDVFEIQVHYKVITYNINTRADAFELHIQFKVMKLQLSIQRNYKILYFQVFPKDRGVFRTH